MWIRLIKVWFYELWMSKAQRYFLMRSTHVSSKLHHSHTFRPNHNTVWSSSVFIHRTNRQIKPSWWTIDSWILCEFSYRYCPTQNLIQSQNSLDLITISLLVVGGSNFCVGWGSPSIFSFIAKFVCVGLVPLFVAIIRSCSSFLLRRPSRSNFVLLLDFKIPNSLCLRSPCCWLSPQYELVMSFFATEVFPVKWNT